MFTNSSPLENKYFNKAPGINGEITVLKKKFMKKKIVEHDGFEPGPLAGEHFFLSKI